MNLFDYQPKKIISLPNNPLARTIGVSHWHQYTPDPPNWLADGIIHYNTINLLDGLGSSGKSILSLQLGIAKASGTDWLGFGINAPGPVIYLNAEDPDAENHRRYNKILSKIALSEEQLITLQNNLTYISLSELDIDPALINEKGRFTDVYKHLQQLVEAVKPALVVIDPLVFFSDAPENDTVNAKRLYSALRRLKTTFLLVHHMSKSAMNGESSQRAKSRGSTVYTENARTRMSLEKGVLTIDKNNFGKTYEGENVIRLVMDEGAWRLATLSEKLDFIASSKPERSKEVKRGY